MYFVEFSYTAEKQFYKLDKLLQDRIISVLERIKVRPYHFVKRKQDTNYFILRIGEYRAILDINDKILKIFILEVGHRKNIYE